MLSLAVPLENNTVAKLLLGSPGGSVVKNLPANAEIWAWSPGLEHILDKEMATYSSILAWKIPRTEKPEGLQSMGSQRVIHDLVTKQQQYKKSLSQTLYKFP